MMKKRIAYYVLLAILLVVLVEIPISISRNKVVSTSGTTCDHCNILLIDIDTLRADSLECYGNKRRVAPNICKFAEKSVLFENNYSPAFWTLPSIFSTITSLYPSFHRVKDSYVDKLDVKIPTIAEVLSREGYKTVYVGSEDNPSSLTSKNGGLRGYNLVTTDPIEEVISNQSKDSKPWFIHYYREDLHMPYILPKNVKPMEDTNAPKNLPITRADFDILLNQYLRKNYTEVFQEKAIREYGSIIFAQEKPDDHSMIDLFYELFYRQFDEQEKFGYLIDVWRPTYLTYMKSFDQNNPQDVAYVRMMYDSMINLIDGELGSLFKKLETKPFSTNTITVFMSDHGESFGEHGKFGHETLNHSELFFTPLIISAPGLTQKKVLQTTGNMDIFPTLLEISGISSHEIELQGISLVPYITDEKIASRLFVTAFSAEGNILINKNWLYLLPNDYSEQILYDKVNDPKEEVNVIEKHSKFVAPLFKQASLIRSYDELFLDEVTSSSYIINVSPEKLERLKKEGYF